MWVACHETGVGPYAVDNEQPKAIATNRTGRQFRRKQCSGSGTRRRRSGDEAIVHQPGRYRAYRVVRREVDVERESPLHQFLAGPTAEQSLRKVPAKMRKCRDRALGFRRQCSRQLGQNRAGADQILQTGAKRAVIPTLPSRDCSDARAASHGLSRHGGRVAQAGGESRNAARAERKRASVG